MDRRRYLLAMVNMYKYLPYYWQNLFYGLVPETINNRTVKNKARVNKIEGNSEVVNQLISNDTSSEVINGITFTNNGDGSWTISGTASATAWKSIGSPISSINNHKILIHGSKTYSGLYLSLAQGTSFYDSGSGFIGDFNLGTAYPVIGVASGTTFTTPITIYPQTTDLSQRYPFDTPTTLTDTRVQNIINRGYIPYNTGEIKHTNLGEISSEPYNLLGLDRTQGTLSGASGSTQRQFEENKYYIGLTVTNLYYPTNVSNCSVSNNSVSITSTSGGYGVGFPIRVIPNQKYTLEYLPTSTYRYISWYDKNGNYISYNDNAGSGVIAPSNAYWGVVLLRPSANTPTTYYDICFHRTGTRTGYVPFNSFQTLPHFNPNKTGTVENTFLQTDTANNFTKRVGVYVFTGNETATFVDNTSPAYGNHYCLSVELPTAISSIIATNYDTLQAKFSHTYKYEYANNDKSAYVNWNITRINFINDSATTEQQAREILAGLVMDFELATYQNISMPLRHLAMVDLGTLNWAYDSSNDRFYTFGISTIIKIGTVNLLCSKYLTATDMYNITTNKTIGAYPSNGNLIIKDTTYGTDATAFKNAMQGQYLYFETADVTADIVIKNNILSFPYQGGGVNTAHNSVEKTNTEWVFTRQVFDVDLGTLNWGYNTSEVGHERFYSTSLASLIKNIDASVLGNLLCSKYQPATDGSVYSHTADKIIGTHNTTIQIYNSSYTDATTFKTALNGVILTYELATPQVIRIPRKHLAWVDLSKCTFTRINANRVETTISDIKPVANDKVVNVYCTKGYIANSYNNTANENVACVNNSTTITFYKTGGFSNTSTSAQIQELFTNIYMFYETQDEVADIDLSLPIESGGTITTNMFSWVENQLITNGNFESSSGWSTVNCSSAIVNNKATITTNTTNANCNFYQNLVNRIVANHRYIVNVTVKVVSATNQPTRIIVENPSYTGNPSIENPVVGTTYNIKQVIKPTGNGSWIGVMLYKANASDEAIYEVSNFSLIDLDIGFSTDIPTSINDPRIQEIIRLGYIPTNTTGTNKSIDTQVLPNLNAGVKCK